MSKLLSLNSGYEMPIIGLGTWKIKPEEVEKAVITAVEAGYRHIDCAYVYSNEVEVGRALRHLISTGKVTRSDLFITGKLWNTQHHVSIVKRSVKECLERLGLDYIDLYLIHWPMSYKPGADIVPVESDGKVVFDDTHYTDTWKELEKCVDDGWIRSIGLSNFNSQQILDIVNTCRIKPAVNQVELHVNLQQQKLIEFCQQHGVAVTAYSCLGSQDRPADMWAYPQERPHWENPVIVGIAHRHGKTPSQVILRWLVQREVSVIPKSSNPSHIKENFQISDFELTEDEMKTIQSMDKNKRSFLELDRRGKNRDQDSPFYPFDIEF